MLGSGLKVEGAHDFSIGLERERERGKRREGRSWIRFRKERKGSTEGMEESTRRGREGLRGMRVVREREERDKAKRNEGETRTRNVASES